MKRIFLEDILTENVTITGDDAHHLAYSLRAQKGDKIVAVDLLGNSATLELVDFDKDKIFAKCISKIKKVKSVEKIKIIRTICSSDKVETHFETVEKIFAKQITLAECLPKQNKFNYIVEKATELGVEKICPLISDRTIARPDISRANAKHERWFKIAKETAEQSARDTLPEIENIVELVDWLKEIEPTLGHFIESDGKKIFDCKGALLLFCYEGEQEQKIQDILQEFKNADCDKNIIVLIGPEGGFSDSEVEKIKSVGGVSVSLGKRILKTDTAAISALAVVQYELS